MNDNVPGISIDEKKHEELLLALYEAVTPLTERIKDEDDEDIEALEDSVVSDLERIVAHFYCEGHADGIAYERVMRERNGHDNRSGIQTEIDQLKPISEIEP